MLTNHYLRRLKLCAESLDKCNDVGDRKQLLNEQKDLICMLHPFIEILEREYGELYVRFFKHYYIDGNTGASFLKEDYYTESTNRSNLLSPDTIRKSIERRSKTC